MRLCETIPTRRGKAEVESEGEAISLNEFWMFRIKLKYPCITIPNLIRNPVTLSYCPSLVAQASVPVNSKTSES